MCSVAYAVRNLDQAYARAAHFAEAEPLLLESHAIFNANHGEQHGMTRAAIPALITLYEQWGKRKKAAE
jgi:hypothetical protein